MGGATGLYISRLHEKYELEQDLPKTSRSKQCMADRKGWNEEDMLH